MRRFVVDASVLVKLYFPEELSEEAERALSHPRTTLFGPDLLYAELANVLWKRARAGHIDPHSASAILAEIRAVPIAISPSITLAQSALTLAIETGRSAYDCFYLALAIASHAVMLTADRRFAHSIDRGPFADYVRWLGDEE